MKFLGIGKDGSLADMYLALQRGGHEVKAFIDDPDWRAILRGLIHVTDDWQRELKWLGCNDGIILFERADQGELQDELRRQGFHVIGGSAFGDRMENDRDFGQQCMRQAGLQTAPVHHFHDIDTAVAFIARRPHRYVLKLNGSGHASSSNVVGELDDGRDISALLTRQRFSGMEKHSTFILMDHLSGVEVGVGGYFNGEQFLDPVVMDWEHKRFFPGDLGELTGEMGTLLTYRGGGRIFEQTLANMTEQLRAGSYVGYININTIINGEGIWPLEFTCRFGYPGAAICSALHAEDWAILFERMVRRDRTDFATRDGFAVGVMLTVPPFPIAEDYCEQSKGLSLLFRNSPTEEDWRHFHLSEFELGPHGLVTTGGTGSLMAVTGIGATAAQAQVAAYQRCANIAIPGLRYRNDIGEKFLKQDQARMRAWGYL